MALSCPWRCLPDAVAAGVLGRGRHAASLAAFRTFTATELSVALAALAAAAAALAALAALAAATGNRMV